MPFPPNVDSWKGAKSDRTLYPTLLLHLGYSIGDTNQEESELLVALCSHWGMLADDALDPEVEIELATQILESNNCNDTAIIEPVLQVVSKLLSTKHAPSLNNDQLAIALTLHIDKYQLVTNLLGQCAAKSSQARVLYTAARLIWREPLDNQVDPELHKVGQDMLQGKDNEIKLNPNEGLNNLLRALSRSREFADIMSKSKHIRKYLSKQSQANTIAQIAQTFPTREITTDLQALLMIDDQSSRNHVLKGLLACSNFFQPSDKDVDVMVQASTQGSALASNLLCQLVEKGKISSETLGYLLATNNIDVLEITMRFISGQSALCSDRHLLRSIAHVAHRDSASPTMQESAVQIFAKAMAKDEPLLMDMARNPNLVEALVKVAPTNPQSMDLLWKLSNPISNRRILACHAGLLPTWIGFVRNLPNPQRDVWKDRLFEISDLL